jgi:hypothetical protein
MYTVISTNATKSTYIRGVQTPCPWNTIDVCSDKGSSDKESGERGTVVQKRLVWGVLPIQIAGHDTARKI